MRAACADTARNWPFANLNGPTASGGLVYSLVARAAGDQKARSWIEPSRNASARCVSVSVSMAPWLGLGLGLGLGLRLGLESL